MTKYLLPLFLILNSCRADSDFFKSSDKRVADILNANNIPYKSITCIEVGGYANDLIQCSVYNNNIKDYMTFLCRGRTCMIGNTSISQEGKRPD